MINGFVFVWYTMTDSNGKATGDSLTVFNQDDFKTMPYTIGSAFSRVDVYANKVLTTTWQA